jgi:hypothetical protein
MRTPPPVATHITTLLPPLTKTMLAQNFTQAPVSTAAACGVGNLHCFLRSLESLCRQLTIL